MAHRWKVAQKRSCTLFISIVPFCGVLLGELTSDRFGYQQLLGLLANL